MEEEREKEREKSNMNKTTTIFTVHFEERISNV
jgi:hypothetical protein